MKVCKNWDNLERQIQNFGNKPPFDHVVVDDFFTKPTADALVSEFPNFESKEHEAFHFVINAIAHRSHNAKIKIFQKRSK